LSEKVNLELCEPKNLLLFESNREL